MYTILHWYNLSIFSISSLNTLPRTFCCQRCSCWNSLVPCSSEGAGILPYIGQPEFVNGKPQVSQLWAVDVHPTLRAPNCHSPFCPLQPTEGCFINESHAVQSDSGAQRDLSAGRNKHLCTNLWRATKWKGEIYKAARITTSQPRYLYQSSLISCVHSWLRVTAANLPASVLTFCQRGNGLSSASFTANSSRISLFSCILCLGKVSWLALELL